MIDKKAREMGLGAAGLISLADARRRAAEQRRLLVDGIDPIEARHAEREKRREESARSISFKECAEKYIAAHESGWRNAKHRNQWKSTLATYAYPVIGHLSVAAVDTALVLKVLEPIWSTKPETGKRLRGRIESVLDWARVREFRRGENPARWRGHLDKLLPSPRKVRKVEHHSALPYAELPAFIADLRRREGISARALEFTILTAARTSEVIGAKWDEIDFTAKTWTVPGERMKAEKEHKVPLCERAISILKSLPRERGNPHVFIGARKGAPLSNMAMLELMKGMRPGFVPHGFRSTFRDWAAERTNYANHVAEMALAHVIDDKVEAAYRRGDLFAKRAALMRDWGRYCAKGPTGAGDNVVALRKGRARASA